MGPPSCPDAAQTTRPVPPAGRSWQDRPARGGALAERALPERTPSERTPSEPAAELARLLTERAAAGSEVRDFSRTGGFRQAQVLLESEGGLRELAALAARFQSARVFRGGPWEDPARLRPPLVKGGLLGSGVNPVMETLSELRLLALATGRAASDRVTADEARAFLEEVLALNLDLLFPQATEEARGRDPRLLEQARRLFALIAEELRPANLRAVVAAEIAAVCVQRQIVTTRAEEMIRLAARLPAPDRPDAVHHQLRRYHEAIVGPTPLSRELPQPRAYRRALPGLRRDELALEASIFARSLRETGLASPHHAALLDFLAGSTHRLLGPALGLDALGEAELVRHDLLVRELLRSAIQPDTAWAIYGLARALERALLSRPEVAAGLRRLLDLEACDPVRRRLWARSREGDDVEPEAVLLAGALSVLGQPLGLGQGDAPTCQAARGLSLWSQLAPGYLLGLLVAAARDGELQLRFEGELLSSRPGDGEPLRELDPEVDPVSLVLVPHLDRLYGLMLRRALGRGDDEHRWVNPALYGPWVPPGFASALRDGDGRTPDYRAFIRLFYATHHPELEGDEVPLVHPTPVGLFVTDSHGRLLGLHAVLVQRVARDPEGLLRVYFFNPNNDGRQDWGQGVLPSVVGGGEREGESSLPFAQFASRLYAFHYEPRPGLDAVAVPEEALDEVEARARASWMRAYPKLFPPPAPGP